MIKFCDNYLLHVLDILNVIEIKNKSVEFVHDYNKIKIIDNFQKKKFFKMTHLFSSLDDKIKILFVNILKFNILKSICMINVIFLCDKIDQKRHIKKTYRFIIWRIRLIIQAHFDLRQRCFDFLSILNDRKFIFQNFRFCKFRFESFRYEYINVIIKCDNHEKFVWFFFFISFLLHFFYFSYFDSILFFFFDKFLKC